MQLLKEICENLTAVRTKQPLVHHITNYVTVNDCANMTLAIGASPVMADDLGEVEEMVSFASALVLNMGTLNERTIASMIVAGKKAKKVGIPVIFDPVGVGATSLRTATAKKIIDQVGPSVIRGNMSEIKILAGLGAAIKGVDSVAEEADGAEVASELSRSLTSVIAITGKQDVIAHGQRICRIDNGHPLLSRVTGTGCMATSLIGCCCGATKDWFVGSATGIMTMGLAGELVEGNLQPGEGVGTFRVRLFDAVAGMTALMLAEGGKIHDK